MMHEEIRKESQNANENAKKKKTNGRMGKEI